MDLPMVIEIVDTEEKVKTLLPFLDDMMGGGLVTLEKSRSFTIAMARRRADCRRERIGKMKFRQLLTVGLAVSLGCVACGRTDSASPGSPAPPGEKLNWLTNFEAAQAQARAGKKMLLINFTGSDWCPPCLMLERDVFKQPEFAEYAAKNLVLLMIDFPRLKMQSLEESAANRKLAERYEIYGFPTIVLLDSSGKEIGQLGYMPGGPKPFITAIEKLRRADATSMPER
jgi:protein disulfide-isomerase